MADISQVKLPSGDTYNIRDDFGGNLYIVKGTQTAKTGTWTGNIDVPALYDGLTIAYYLPYAGDGNATLNLTLADGTTTTGAVNVYYSNANRMTTHYGAGSTIILTYWSAGSISVAGTATTDNRWTRCEYDSTNTYRLTDYYGYYTAYTALYRYQICLTKNETSILPINTVSNSTATTKTLTTESFNPFGPIFYYATTTTVSAGSNIGANTLGYQYLADLRYSFNTGSTLIAATAVYLVATLGTGCSATLASNPISQVLPSTEDGLIYIYLGQAYDTYRIELSVKHPVYRYINGALRVLKADDVVTVNGITPGAAMAKGVVTSIDTSANLPTSNAVKTFVENKGYITSYTETDPVFSASAAAGITSTNISNWNSKTSNTGTVTSITVSNATNGGLTVSGSPVTTSGTVTIGHSNVLTSAQTTQAVYPIKIDKNGHISAYGSAVTIPTVPTNVSSFTNDSGYLTLATLPIYDGTVV